MSGGGGGGGGRGPVEGKNTAKSAQRYTSIHAIAEGVLAGFGNGDDAPMKSVYLNDTPVQNADGSFNFLGVEIFAMPGTLDQSNVPGFDTTERAVGVSTEVKQGAPVVRTIVDSAVDTLRVTVAVNMNTQTKDNGDTVASSTSVVVELLNSAGVATAKTVTFREKSGSMYQQDVVFNTLPPAPFSVRVSRTTANSTSSRLVNNTYFSSYVEIITAKLSYPHTALLCLKVDSEQFGGSIPRVNVLSKAKLIKVPSNYNPEARTYSSPIWDGSFKEAWTNNPGWWVYDFLTQPRYSGLAKRLNMADVDKWAFYEIAKYCDQLVDDGYGGKEPRFTFNAYLTDERPAADVLNDLASCFRGMAYWNGQMHTATLDRNTDPVALYNNSNVVDGLFTYSGVGRKSIHTAVLVSYVDKTNGYRTATEYVSDEAAVRRYGLNVKNITAFGCDSRGQAYRIGKWLLHTELTQQETISFSVGREGLRHLPNDIVQVLDSERVGAQVGGRVTAVAGRVITLDREIGQAAGNIIGGTIRYRNLSGGITEAAITAQPSETSLQLAKVPEDIKELAEWVFVGKVKPVLYRCVSITENTEDGTYTVNALLHDPNKEAVVDNGAVFDKEIKTLHSIDPELIDGSISVSDSGIDLAWDTKATSGGVVSYNVDVYRNGVLYRQFFGLKDPNVRLENLPNGNYTAEIRGRNARGVLSAPLVKAWSINYTITGLRTEAKLFAIGLTWTLPEPVVRAVHTEIWCGTENDINKATKLAALPYPQNEYTLTGVKISDRYYFWARIVDDGGISGEYTASVAGVCDTDPAPIIAQITGAITESTLSRELINQFDSKIAAGDSKTAADAAKALQAEANARTAAIGKEISDRVADVNAARSKAAGDLTAKAAELGNKITAVENVNTTQAQQINTVTAAQGATAAGLETEKKARADGDAAEAAARTTLAARVTAAEGSITRNDGLRVTGDKANADAIAAMGVRVGSAESGVTNLQQTVATNQAATATDIKTLQASVGAGANLMQDSEFKYGFTYLRTNAGGGDVTIGMNHDSYTVSGRNILFVRRAFVDTSNRSVILQRMAIQRGKVYQVAGDCYQKGGAASGCKIYVRPVDATGAWNSTGVQVKNVGAAAVHDSRPFEYGHFVRSGENIRIDAASPVTHIDIAFSVRETTDTSVLMQLLTNPMICEVASIDAPLVPYSPGTDPLIGVSEAGFNAYKQAQASADAAQTAEINAAKSSIAGNTAKVTALETTVANNQSAMASRVSTVETQTGQNTANITTTSSAVTSLTGKVSALHTVKVEAISGGRKVVAGTALGVDGATGDSQFLVYADKFGMVNPSSNQIDTPFVINNTAGVAKMALNGDFVATGSILGSHIAANQTIQAPNILGGSLNIGGGNFTVNGAGTAVARDITVQGGGININNNFIVNNKGELTAKSGRFEGEVYADKISGGVLQFFPPWSGASRTFPVGKGRRQFIIEDFSAIFPRASANEQGGANYYINMLAIYLDDKVVAAAIAAAMYQFAQGWVGSKLTQFRPFGNDVNYTYIPFSPTNPQRPGDYLQGATQGTILVIDLGNITSNSQVKLEVSGGLYWSNFTQKAGKPMQASYKWSLLNII